MEISEGEGEKGTEKIFEVTAENFLVMIPNHRSENSENSKQTNNKKSTLRYIFKLQKNQRENSERSQSRGENTHPT